VEKKSATNIKIGVCKFRYYSWISKVTQFKG